MEKVSKNPQETEQIAKIFLTEILADKKPQSSALVIGLVGNLGAGKTTFFQSVAKNLGVKEKVISPTFVIMKKYPIKNEKYGFLFHLDAYRLKNEKQLLPLGWKEILSDERHLIFIEWPENVRKALPLHSKFIHIVDDGKGVRRFKLKS
jgi:tRNA threonylcarbamoyladenosine biosynthesis protein TsaE